MKVSIIGATGYTGMELVRILAQHPKVEISRLTSHSFSGKNIAEIYANFKGQIEHICQEIDIDDLAAESDLAFTALPHGVAMEYVPKLREAGLKVIDLSGDYRYNNLKTYEKWYQKHSGSEFMKESVYGLVELFREEIKEADLIANPGCYPTVSTLALAPILKTDLASLEGIIIDAKSGATGAGRKLSLGTHFCEVNNNFKAYKVFKHRHCSEIEEKLGLLTKKELNLTFTPHLLPVNRGILATIYLNLEQEISTKELTAKYQDFYQAEEFVRVYGEQLPELKNVAGSNFCDIAVRVEGKQVIIIAAIDNLIKGSAGQAVQSMNLLAGYDESLGLKDVGLYL